jgi:hypothetical protein
MLWNCMSRHSLSKHFRVHGAVLNLFDKSPPLDIQTYGGGGGASFDGAFHDPGGRALLWLGELSAQTPTGVRRAIQPEFLGNEVNK